MQARDQDREQMTLVAVTSSVKRAEAVVQPGVGRSHRIRRNLECSLRTWSLALFGQLLSAARFGSEGLRKHVQLCLAKKKAARTLRSN
jgi:hypothetical protein